MLCTISSTSKNKLLIVEKNSSLFPPAILKFIQELSTLNNNDVLLPTSFETIVRFQQKDKSLIQIDKEKPKDYSITQ